MPSFSHVDTFPVINRLIQERTWSTSPFVTHADLVDALLDSADGARLIADAEAKSKLDPRQTASNMVAWFSQAYTQGANSFAKLLDRQKVGVTWAYRSRDPSPPGRSLVLDVDATAIEGNPKLTAHVLRERNPKLVKEKLAAVKNQTGRLACECCGFDAAVTFPGVQFPIVEVHHRIMLSSQTEVVTTTLQDLALLCPTCHRGIHRTDGLTVEEFKRRFFPRS